MTIYFFCEDNFFSSGAVALLQSHNVLAEVIDRDRANHSFSKDDVVIIETTCDLIIKNMVTQATHDGANFLLVFDIPCHITQSVIWSHNHFSKKIDKHTLINLLQHIKIHNNKYREDLSLCEIQVMVLLLKGRKTDEISLNFGIPLKKVLEHKNSALIKTGIINDNSLYLLNFKKIITAQYYCEHAQVK
ncbi:helix-turn-helix transcriptional regulator [Serratia sp. NPDC078593]|uniref:helix-turn-helix transcriptional regulator n=1 Tax=unclassified Serratia (in: enterobacteria) TaxID=2647522 RepID=UPI0037D93BA0